MYKSETFSEFGEFLLQIVIDPFNNADFIRVDVFDACDPSCVNMIDTERRSKGVDFSSYCRQSWHTIFEAMGAMFGKQHKRQLSVVLVNINDCITSP